MEGRPPILKVGKYSGVPIDQVPMSYLRWMITQDFDKELVAWAKKKVGDSVKTSGAQVDVTRHAYDKYSLYFIDKWIHRRDSTLGFGSFLANEAHFALKLGKDTSRPKRFAKDTHEVYYNGVKWVFSDITAEIPVLITVYP